MPEARPRGVYLNLVEGRLWVPDVVGSNPITPTKNPLLRFWAVCQRPTYLLELAFF